MRAVEIAEGIHWVGAVDWDLRDFHGFETPKGTTYNAYLAVGEDGVALIDTVKTGFVGESLSRVSEVVDLADVTHVVVNHLEPDHNSGLRHVLSKLPNARAVASPSGARGVGEYHPGIEVEAVKDEVIDLGGLTLRFLPMPMVHWPDSMFTWCPERAVLMPNDGFGQHVASSERFADELGLDDALEEARIYFANILMPLTKQVGRAIEKVVEAGIEPAVIAPSHGVVWRQDSVATVLEAYVRWVACEASESVVVAYGTMWDSTRALARAVADGVAEEGVRCRVFDLSTTPFADVTAAVMDARAVAVGSATLHGDMLWRVAGYLHYLKGVGPPAKTAAVFGSYGWSGGACEQMGAKLEAMGMELPVTAFTVKFRPTADDLEAARAWGAELARSIR